MFRPQTTVLHTPVVLPCKDARPGLCLRTRTCPEKEMQPDFSNSSGGHDWRLVFRSAAADAPILDEKAKKLQQMQERLVAWQQQQAQQQQQQQQQ